MAERREVMEQEAVRDASPVYSVEAGTASAGDVPPGYKRTEVGVIPEDWEIASIRDLGAVVTGGTPPTSDASNYGDDLPFATPADIGYAKYIRSTLRSLSCKGAALVRRLSSDSILFVSIGSTIGKCGMATMDMTSNQQINAVLPYDRCYPDYLYYAISLASDRIKDWAGTQAVPIVNKSQFSATRLPVPGVEEQRAIATALSDADALIESLDHLIAKKRAVKQAAMQQLLTGQTRLPGFTGEWETKRFGAVLERRNLKSHQIQTTDYRKSGKYPVVDQGQEAVVGFTDRDDKVFSCPTVGVIVFGDHTCIVKFVDFDFAVGADGTQVLQAKPGQCTRFYAYQLEYNGVQPTGYNRHFKFLKEKSFPVPEREEQTAIATVLSDMDTEIEALEHRRDKARQIKQGMMQQLLTGRVRLVDETREGASYG